METPSRPTEPDGPFEHPSFEALYARALRDVIDRRLAECQRKAAARAVAFLLRERLVDEAVATDVLTALWKSLDLAAVVTTILLALHEVSAPEKLLEWTKAVADRANSAGRIASLVSALRVLIRLQNFDGGIPTNWQLSLVRSLDASDGSSLRRLYHLADGYAHRFGTERWWVKECRMRRIVEAHSRSLLIEGTRTRVGG